MSLRARLIGLFFVITLVAVGLFAYLSFTTSRRTIEAQTFQRLSESTALKEAEFNRWLETSKISLRQIARRPLVIEASQQLRDLDLDSSEFEAIASELRATHFSPILEEGCCFDDVALINGTTAQILVATNPAIEGTFAEYAPYFIEGQQATYVASPTYQINAQAVVMHLSTPLKDASGNTVAVLAAHLDLEEMSDIMQQNHGLYESSETYLVNDFNFFVTESRFTSDAPFQQAVYSEGVSRCLDRANGTGTYTDYRGVVVMGAFRWIPEPGLCIVSEVDASEALQPIDNLLLQTIEIALAVLVVSLGASWLFSRSITRPISQLVSATETVAQGNLDYQIPPIRLQELGRLANSFNAMMRSLSAVTVSRDQLTEEIEQHKLTQASLIESQQTLSLSLKAAGAGVWVWDIATGRIQWDETLEAIHGLAPGTFEGTYDAWKAKIHPDDLAEAEQAIRNALEDTEPFDMEFRVLLPDGGIRYVLGQAIVMRGANNHPEGMIGTWIDITERKTSEVIIELANRELRNLNGVITQTNRELDILNRVIAHSSATHDLGDILESTCHELSKALEFACVKAAVQSEDDDTYIVKVLSGCSESHLCAVEEMWFEPSAKVLAHLQRSDEPLVINVENYHDYLNDDMPTGVHEMTYIGLKYNYKVSCIFQLISRESVNLSLSELNLAVRIVQSITHAISNSYLHQQIMQQNRDLNQLVAQRTQELQRTNDRLRTILDNTSDAIALLDANFRIRMTNVAFTKQLGYHPNELKKSSLNFLVEGDDETKLDSALAQIKQFSELQRLELSLRHKNASILQCDVAIAFVGDAENHTVVTIRDITHLKEVETVKDAFVSMVSHELRNPVSTVMLGLGIMKEYYPRMSDEQRQAKLSELYAQSENLADLIKSILDMSRLDARKGRRATDRVDVAAALHEVYEQLMVVAQEKRQHLKMEVFRSRFTIYGDSQDFARIWQNLIGNAIKYTDNCGTINITLVGGAGEDDTEYPIDFDRFTEIPSHVQSSPEDFIVGWVEDSGHGIDPDDYSKLFGRFFRGWASNSNIQGTGLGLSLVRELLHMYEGDIAVSSDLGVGSVFYFWIPIGVVE